MISSDEKPTAIHTVVAISIFNILSVRMRLINWPSLRLEISVVSVFKTERRLCCLSIYILDYRQVAA